VVYISQTQQVRRDDLTELSDWGNGAPIYLMFAVQDTGRGLTEGETDMLFRRFSQASPRTHVQYGGSGLGLYISRELTEKQGGQIGVSSVAGSGSTFAFYIKSKRAEALPVTSQSSSDVSSSHRNGTNHIQANGKLALRKGPTIDTGNANIPVLIVEDNLVNRRVLKKALSRLGFPILEAGHGEEALDMIRQSKYWKGQEETGKDIAVMLLDWEMPVLDGIGCIRKVRELEAEGAITRHLNTIAVTANARKEQIDIAMEAGMDDLISKPFTTEAMVQRIKKWAASRS
jgi:CheY-like chemotaxis protein